MSPDPTLDTNCILLAEAEGTTLFSHALPMLAAFSLFALLTACAVQPAQKEDDLPTLTAHAPFRAQVVGLQWLNPLQRLDYPTEWQLLWTLGLAKPNENDDMVRTDPRGFSTLQAVAPIAHDLDGTETFKGYHYKYVRKLTSLFHDIYYSSPTYFYRVYPKDQKQNWRELAGIRVEYALPAGKLDPEEARNTTRERIIDTFSIGNVNFPTLWTRATPPDVRITLGGNNAGFVSLQAALAYLEAHPQQTAWVMNWDAPSRPKTMQINENLVLLVLAGPDYKTERAALAWIGYPATKNVADFELAKDQPPRAVQAWQALFAEAARQGGKTEEDIGYVIHDASQSLPSSSDRLGQLAHALTLEVPGFDFLPQTFNTPALLGEMGAGTALTNVALAIAHANHVGKSVLVAGTSDPASVTGVLVSPPATVRPIAHDRPWFRARGENHAYLPWWGIRHDAADAMQGYSD
ncbi:virulence factor [Janthinobacterium sp. PSPC2-1]|uniref:virulence factor n=1 Tax=unclassified Janthinobacterium TaxID=2610881 RepID=UPI003CF1C972